MRNSTEIAKRPRGRPRAFDRDAALSAAGQRFRTHGYAGTSLDDLTDATGVNRPSLYAAFGDKRALYLAALARTEQWLTGSFEGLLRADVPLHEAVARMLRYSIDIYLSGETGPSGCIALNTATVEAVTDPEIRAALGRVLALEDRMVTAILAQAGSATPAAHAAIVTGMLHSLSIRARAGESKESMTRLALDCADVVAGAPPPPA